MLRANGIDFPFARGDARTSNSMKKLISLWLVLILPLVANAWGRRGHSTVGETAAQLVAKSSHTEFLRNHSYDLGYYSNVPDFIWKKPATYEIEKPNHFMDLEIFQRAFSKRTDTGAKPFEMSRLEFEAKFPEIPASAGRAYWRIRELNQTLESTASELRRLQKEKPAEAVEAQRKLQETWLLTAGVLSHYVGDLGMPLHVSENYDGQLTGQKGIHSHFEDRAVDELYPSITKEVYDEALKLWPAFTKKHAKTTVLEMVEKLAAESTAAVPGMLAIDKKLGRKNLKKSAEAFRPLIRKRLAASSLVLAEIYRRSSEGIQFDDNRFFFFKGEPDFIAPPKAEAGK